MDALDPHFPAFLVRLPRTNMAAVIGLRGKWVYGNFSCCGVVRVLIFFIMVLKNLGKERVTQQW